MICNEEHLLDMNPSKQIQAREMPGFPLSVSVFAPLVENRWVALLLAIIGILQLTLVFFGLPGWICPFKAVLGLPCPGCGISTAIVALLHGDWERSLSIHAFASVFLLGIVAIFVSTLLPYPLRTKIIDKIDNTERRSGLTFLLMIALIVYWLIRLMRLI